MEEDPLLKYRRLKEKAEEAGIAPERILQYLQEMMEYLQQTINPEVLRYYGLEVETREELEEFIKGFSENLKKLEVETAVKRFLER